MLIIIISGCKKETPEPVQASPESEADEIRVSQYSWHAGDTPAGETLITRTGDGKVTNELFMHWNNREYRLNSELQLNTDGLITAQRITGVSPFGATIDETFSLDGEVARWKTAGDAGTAQSGSPSFYVSTQSGALASTEALVQAAMSQINQEIGLYPSGTARVAKELSTTVSVNGGDVTLHLYSISGLDYSPIYAWFDDDLILVARDLGRMGMIPTGWSPEILKQLGRVQAEQNASNLHRVAGEFAVDPGPAVLFEGVSILDVNKGELLENHHVLVEEGVISTVSSQPISYPEATKVKADGKVLMPGLWDMHGHHGLVDGILNIAGGVTSVRDLGSTHERIMELVEQFDSGALIGPHTYRAAMIDQAGPYANRNPVSSVEQALEYIDRFASQGYVQIKLYSSISPEWVPAIAERTHEHGMRLSGHVPAFMSARQAIEAGFDEIQHINMVFLNFLVGDQGDTRQQIRFTTYGNEGGELDLDGAEVSEFIDLMLEKGTVVDPTAAIFHSMMTHVAGEPDPTYAVVADHLPANVRRGIFSPMFEIGEERMSDWAATAERQAEMLHLLWQKGVPLVAGTDSTAGFGLHSELEVYVKAGIPVAEVLKLATIGSAKVLGLEGQTGSIEPGKAADLVLLDKNPLQDINAIRAALLVMKDGKLFQPSHLHEAVGVKPFTEPYPLVQE